MFSTHIYNISIFVYALESHRVYVLSRMFVLVWQPELPNKTILWYFLTYFPGSFSLCIKYITFALDIWLSVLHSKYFNPFCTFTFMIKLQMHLRQTKCTFQFRFYNQTFYSRFESKALIGYSRISHSKLKSFFIAIEWRFRTF